MGSRQFHMGILWDRSGTYFSFSLRAALMWREQVVVYPMWESRQSLREIGGHIVRDVFGGGKGVKKEVVQA